MKMPQINIFLMMPPMSDTETKKKSILTEALKSKREDMRHREVKSLPHAQHLGG